MTLDTIARILVTATFFIWNLFEGTVLESPYPEALLKLYDFHFWRFLVAIAVIISSYWCPHVGAMVALTVFFYIEDLEKLRKPLLSISR